MSIENKELRVTMPNGVKYDIPVSVIAHHRANYYLDFFDGSMFESLENNTLPLFEKHEYKIIEWANNNMDWLDVAGYAERVEEKEINFQQGWLNGEKTIMV